MNGPDDNADRTFERRAKAAFDESVAALDAQTRSHLTQARHAALSRIEPEPAARKWRLWVPATGLAAAALAAVGVALFKLNDDKQLPAGTRHGASLEDMDLLAADDDMDIMEDLDFYSWLDSANDERAG